MGKSNRGERARTFAYLMSPEGKEITDKAIFTDISNTIFKALEAVYQKNSQKILLTNTAFEIALKQLL